MSKLKSALAARRSDFAQNQRGNVAMMFALIALPIFLVVGLAIDASRASLVRYHFQTALDAAALAVGSTYKPHDELETMAQAYVRKNFIVEGTTINRIRLIDNGQELTLSGNFTMNTYFMGLIERGTLDVSNATEVKRAGGGLLVTMVLDNTGSMAGSRIASLRESSQALVNELFSEENNTEDLRVGIVPYAASVNPGSEAEYLLSPFDLSVLDLDNALGWHGCVFERSGLLSTLTDLAPSVLGGYWTPYIYPPGPDNNFNWGDEDSANESYQSNSGTGPNLGCPTPIVPLTNSKGTLDAAIANMKHWNRGGTLTDIGMAWGIRVMTPGNPFNESAEIDPITTGSDTPTSLWDSSRWRKAIVLMTDGESQFYDGYHSDDHDSDITGYGREGTGVAFELYGSSASRSEINTNIASLCQQAKDMGIIVYTVVFTSSVGTDTRTMYEECASDPGKYWYAPDSDALANTFEQIGSDLSRLRITR
ncbi:MAG: pilus assembly protein [Hyphomonadaceae bacterium]|nr:pilus assembly protein [Hyphomonadaceae bacterium]